MSISNSDPTRVDTSNGTNTPINPPAYIHRFNNGPGGWIQVVSNGTAGVRPLEIKDGVAISRSPWWIDYNHAPPGAGYLHLLFALHTAHDAGFPPEYKEIGGPNAFVAGGFPLDFRNAQLTFRLKGELNARGAQLVFLAQARVGSHVVGHLLTGQPLAVTTEWCEQTITLVPDEKQWQCLGVRHDRGETYAWGNVEDVLRCLNVDFMLLLYPLDVAPAAPLAGAPNLLKAGEDYEVNRARLPSGYVMLDEVRIQFADNGTSLEGSAGAAPPLGAVAE